jgi:2,3-bisphosphoglycerate-independent phosphoglycerate mutase
MTVRLENTPAVLIVRDGWGENPHPEHDAFNAVKLATTPVARGLAATWPTTLIATSGEDVGLPAGTMGNSEVGHQNIGAGRIVHQEVMRITCAIRDGSFDRNGELRGAFEHALATGGAVHLLGLASDGRVHSDLDHLLALIDLAAKERFPAARLFVHAITDGRDTAPFGGLEFVARVEKKLKGAGRIASVIGRYWALDRDHRWDRVAAAYACLTGRGPAARAPSAEEAIRRGYAHAPDASRQGDEFIVPTIVGSPAEGRIRDGDAVIFFNFRGDRPREVTKAFVLDDAAWSAVKGGGFDRGPRLGNLRFVAMSMYEEGLPVRVAFPRPPRMVNILGAFLEAHGIAQFRCAETEKFPHVTFFLNDYREAPFAGERRLLVPSPRDVATYDLKPEMSADAVCTGVLERIAATDGEPAIVVNFANGDMVGHTGNLAAATIAIEVVDACVGRIIDAVLAKGGSAIVTADHGNAEQMWDPIAGVPHTAHTTYDVPLHVVGEAFRGKRLRAGGRLADIAPTLLTMIGLRPPAEMTGRTLL